MADDGDTEVGYLDDETTFSCGRNSPGLDYYNYYAYFVSSGGGVDNYSNADWDSCGMSSPVLEYDYYSVCQVRSGGNVDYYDDWSVADSCGVKLSGHQ